MTKLASPDTSSITGVKLRVHGKPGEGGVVEVSRGTFHSQVLIPGALFDVLSVLILAAKARPGAWGFMTAKELARELTRRDGGDIDRPLHCPKAVIRRLFRLRRKLADAAPLSNAAGRRWARRLVESTTLGYRLTLDPDDIELAVYDDRG